MSITIETATIIAAVIGAVGALVAAIVQIAGHRADRTKADAGAAPHEIVAGTPGRDESISGQMSTSRTKDQLERIMSSGVLRAGCIKHPPLSDFAWKGDQAFFSGYYIELCKEVCAAHGLTPEFVAVDWADLPEKVFSESMNLDLVLSVFETSRRSELGDFVACLHKVKLTGFTQQANTKVTTLEDLHKDDVRIVVIKGEAGHEFVTRELKVPRHRLVVIEDSDITELASFVLTNRVDVAICDEVSSDECVCRHPELKQIFRGDEFYVFKNCIMTPKNQPKLREWVDSEFRKAKALPRLVEMENSILSDQRKLIRRYS